MREYTGEASLAPITTSRVIRTQVTSVDEEGTVGGTVPATLALTLGPAVSFGAFTPGVTKTYEASTTATVISTAGDATLTVSEPGFLANGAFKLAQPLQVSGLPKTLERPGHQRRDVRSASSSRSPARPAAHGLLREDPHLHVEHDHALALQLVKFWLDWDVHA